MNGKPPLRNRQAANYRNFTFTTRTITNMDIKIKPRTAPNLWPETTGTEND
jgi:hypothetical protein